MIKIEVLLLNERKRPFVNEKLGTLRMSDVITTYFFLSEDYSFKENDIVDIKYIGTCQIISVSKYMPYDEYCTKVIIESCNGEKIDYKLFNQNKKEMNGELVKKNKMFSSIIENYKSQFIPTKEEGVRMAMDGTMCVLVGDKYVGHTNGKLVSYPTEMTLKVPCYSINKPQSSVNVGDVVKVKATFGKVLAKNEDGSLKVLSFSGYIQNKQEVTDFMFGEAMVRVIMNVFNFENSTNGFNPLLFALAEGDSLDAKGLLALSMTAQGKNLFSQCGNGFNPMMLMLLDKGGDNDFFSTLMFMNMMKGFGLGNMFAPNEDDKKEDDAVKKILANKELMDKLKEAIAAE